MKGDIHMKLYKEIAFQKSVFRKKSDEILCSIKYKGQDLPIVLSYGLDNIEEYARDNGLIDREVDCVNIGLNKITFNLKGE